MKQRILNRILNRDPNEGPEELAILIKECKEGWNKMQRLLMQPSDALAGAFDAVKANIPSGTSNNRSLQKIRKRYPEN